MKIFFARLYSIYFALIFTGLFLAFFPFQLLFSFKYSWHRYALWFNKPWAWGIFIGLFLCGVRVKIMGKKNLPRGQFILCSNHFSYLDIPAIGLLHSHVKFFGKSSLSKFPLFGWMYKRLHVTVDRNSFKSRAHSLSMSRKAIKKGFNMAFFPEGGVRVSQHPKMGSFRDGAFRMAVEFQIPIVPISMPTNYTIWPYDGRYLIFSGTSRIFIHEPLYPKDTTEEAVHSLKEKTRNVIQSHLDSFALK